MPPLQASAEERRNLIAYLSSLGGVQPGALAGVDATISSEAIERRPAPQTRRVADIQRRPGRQPP